MPTLHAVITKEFTFRGKPERFSNGYNLQTTGDLNSAAFVKSVCDALVTMEKAFHASDIKFVYSVGGPIGQDATYAEEYATQTTGTFNGNTGTHPETCYMAESKIAPKKYLRKFYHGNLGRAGGAGNDLVDTTARTTMTTALAKLTDGTLPGAATYCRPNGSLALVPFTVDPYIRVHQLKRRGKRP